MKGDAYAAEIPSAASGGAALVSIMRHPCKIQGKQFGNMSRGK